MRDLKVLIAHKDNIAELLREAYPKMNQQYFALEEMDMPRVMLKNSIAKYEELNGAFTTALGVKESLVAKLKAYEVCKPIVEDDLETDDPVKSLAGSFQPAF